MIDDPRFNSSQAVYKAGYALTQYDIRTDTIRTMFNDEYGEMPIKDWDDTKKQIILVIDGNDLPFYVVPVGRLKSAENA